MTNADAEVVCEQFESLNDWLVHMPTGKRVRLNRPNSGSVDVVINWGIDYDAYDVEQILSVARKKPRSIVQRIDLVTKNQVTSNLY